MAQIMCFAKQVLYILDTWRTMQQENCNLRQCIADVLDSKQKNNNCKDLITMLKKEQVPIRQGKYSCYFLQFTIFEIKLKLIML